MAQITTKRLPTTGVVIRAWRIFRGFSSTELAEKAGVRLGYLSEIEHDRKIRPDEDYLEKLANALHVPLKDILGRRMPPKKRGRIKLKRAPGAMQTQKQPTAPQPTIARSALALPDSLLYLTFAQIEARIDSRDLSEEQMKRMAAGLLDSTDLLLDMIKPQYEE
jgi:transcriptional regulator with XRE-family HTH domain